MPTTLGLALLAWAGALGLSQGSSFTEKGLSLLSYQLCNYHVTRRVQKVEAVQTSRVIYTSCGGWIPWRQCPKTVYQTQYLATEVPESKNVTDCCEGHEQLGLYCVLPLNRSREFASRPGSCPASEPELPTPRRCSWDTDCPGLQKCCPWPAGHRCTAPVPRAPPRSLVSWYNITVLVKMDFEDLQQVDPGFRNHTRLLYSLVTSALQPLNPAVHYLHSAGGDTFTTVSWLLLGLTRLLPVANVSAMLDDMVKRVYEVINIQVQDVNECLYDELHTCSEAELCQNMEGSHLCVRAQESSTSSPQRPNHTDSGMQEVPVHACVESGGPGMCGICPWLSLAGDVVNSTGSGLSAVAGVTVPALDSGTAVPSPESLTLSPSPWTPQGTPATSQAQTPGPPSRRGAGDLGSHDRNSTGPGAEEEAPSTAPSWETGPGSTRGGLSTAAAEAPAPPRGSPHGTKPSTPESPGQLLGNTTTEPPSPPTTKDASGHVVWHTGLPPRETPVNAATLQTKEPEPAPGPSLPSAPTPVPLQHPACGPGSVTRVTVSNVSSTGFHLQWAADPAPLPTFHLSLVPARGPAVSVDTQNTSVALSGLEPGVLHLVQITARACGKEGTRTDLKVRTAAQKLRGKVRIANVRYSEALGNASSQEHRDFVGRFLSTVREPLPAMLRQHMDAGGIRLNITSITNGSVVVDFTLLVIADVDIREVSAAFLSALHNASRLEVVRGDPFIQDFDECASMEHDCVPGTACHNTFGSFACSCAGGASNFHVEFSGRPCEGASPGNASQAPGPEQPLPPAGTRAGAVPGASSAAQGRAPRLTLTEAVDVSCEVEKVALAVQRRFLQQESIPAASLYLGQPSCNASSSNGSHVFLVAGWGECGTLVQSNMTDTVVRTTLRNDLSPEGVLHHPKILSPILCAFRNNLLASSGYAPQWGVYTIVEDLHGAGNFVTEMQVFIGDSPIPQNYSVSASDDVKIEVGLYRQKSNLRVVLMECWATPSSNARDPVTFGFINNSCPIPNTYTSVIQNGDSSKAQFKLRIFSFVNNSIVYLHCKLRVCLENPGATCKISCRNFRSVSNSEDSEFFQMSWGPLMRSERSSPCVKPGPGAGLILLIVGAVLVVVGAAAAFLITRYQRMTGNYNLKAQAGNFGYQVFYE
ncbi:PREDICTED: uromodulin-like 1 [Dipodomys ordii]|uniref:Uromodulin-like 1 n=1 Tax=Dipodomys ordii TaxID=10020 RepID=A0A1S3G3D3_DIPOR|nr:PREDICTED: uromodulin-like 1 [Dipodomys ordii]